MMSGVNEVLVSLDGTRSGVLVVLNGDGEIAEG